jgi:hypothetical protein
MPLARHAYRPQCSGAKARYANRSQVCESIPAALEYGERMYESQPQYVIPGLEIREYGRRDPSR